jgi:hypothetical protein
VVDLFYHVIESRRHHQICAALDLLPLSLHSSSSTLLGFSVHLAMALGNQASWSEIFPSSFLGSTYFCKSMSCYVVLTYSYSISLYMVFANKIPYLCFFRSLEFLSMHVIFHCWLIIAEFFYELFLLEISFWFLHVY